MLNKTTFIIFFVFVSIASIIALYFSYIEKMFPLEYFYYGFAGTFITASIAITFSQSHKIPSPSGFRNRPERSKSNELASGDLATKKDLKKWLKRTDDLDTILPVKDLRGSEGLILKKGDLVIPNGERNRHVLIIAKTGGGKTTKFILPILYNDCLSKHRSSIVLDSKPEMWDKLAEMTRRYNPEKKILLFNALDRSRSLSWNILAKVTDDTDAKLIANTLISATDNPSSKGDSPFFRNNALSLLNAIMVGLINDPNEEISVPRLHQIVHSGMKNLCFWLEAHPHALRSTKNFVDLARSGSQNADTIMSELSMRLAAWDLEAIRACTYTNELDLESLIKEPTLLIIELRESEIEMLRPMANVIVVEILRYLTKYAETCHKQTLPRPVSLVIDEFASALGKLPDIHVKLNTLRSRNVSIVAAIQSIAQIKANYSEQADPVIAGFSNKILMPMLDFQDSEWASKECGNMTVRFSTGRRGSSRKITEVFANKSSDYNENIQQRAVLTPDEIGRPPDNICTFFMPNTPVFQGHLVPYYEHPEMSKRIGIQSKDGTSLILRERPLEMVEKPLPNYEDQEPGSSQISKNATPQEVLDTIHNKLEEISFSKSKIPEAAEWWKSFEKANESNPQPVLVFLEQLIARKCTLDIFYYVFSTADTTDLQAILKKIDDYFLQLKKNTLQYDLAPSHVLEWWKAFENLNKDKIQVMLKLCDELIARDSTIEEFVVMFTSTPGQTIEQVLEKIKENKNKRPIEKQNISSLSGKINYQQGITKERDSSKEEEEKEEEEEFDIASYYKNKANSNTKHNSNSSNNNTWRAKPEAKQRPSFLSNSNKNSLEGQKQTLEKSATESTREDNNENPSSTIDKSSDTESANLDLSSIQEKRKKRISNLRLAQKLRRNRDLDTKSKTTTTYM